MTKTKKIQLDIAGKEDDYHEHHLWFLETISYLRPTYIIGIDPGETTGICSIHAQHDYLEIAFSQLNTSTGLDLTQSRSLADCVDAIDDWIWTHRPYSPISTHAEEPDIHFVIEDYRIYKWKADAHIWSSVHTVQLIGALKYALECYDVHMQSAQEGKAFFTDSMLSSISVFSNIDVVGGKTRDTLHSATRGAPHARDAIRHALQYLVFTISANANSKQHK